MNRSSQYPISDELLSAYIDGDVTEEEKQQIEHAIAVDPEIRWQVETLRQTVDLLRELPPVVLPRSFVLQEEQVADILSARRSHAPRRSGSLAAGSALVWRQLLSFFNSGNLALRNASAVAAVLFVVLILGKPYLGGQIATPSAQPAEPMAAQMESAPVQTDAMAASEAAPAADMAETADETEPASPVGLKSAGVDEDPGAEQAPQPQEVPEPQTRALISPESAEEQASPQIMTYSAEAEMVAPEDSGAAPLPAEGEPASEPTSIAEATPAPVELESMASERAETQRAESVESSAEAATSATAADLPEQEETARQEEEIARNPAMDVTALEVAEDERAADPQSRVLVPEPTLAVTAEPAADTTELTHTSPIELESVETELDEAAGTESVTDVPGADGERVAVETASEPMQTARWDTWQIMQASTLSLALILLLLWLGSRRRHLNP